MARVRATTKLGNYNPTALALYAASIVTAMTTNVATFPTPPVALATITTNVTALYAAIAAWGVVGARGSHADLIALRNAVKVVQVNLQVTAAYVNQVAVGFGPTVALSGFTGTNPHTVIGVLGAPQDFRQLVSLRTLNGEVILKWKKPLNIGFGKVPTYVVEAFDSPTGNWVQVAITTRTKATIKNKPYNPATSQFLVRCYAVNSAGNGAMTADLLVTAFG